MELKSVSCRSNLCDFRKYTRPLQMLILSLQSLLQNQSLETIQVCIVVLCFPHHNIAGIHLYDECTKSNASSVCHKVFVHFVTARASLFTDHEISGLPIRAKYKHFRTICDQTVDNSPTDSCSSSFSDGHPCMALQLCIIVESFYSQVRNIFPHISLHDLPCHRTKKMLFLHQVSLNL